MEALDAVVEAVRRSGKYRNVCEEVIRGIGARELAKERSFREAVKATKAKLHQVGAAYLAGPLPYDHWLAQLGMASEAGERNQVRTACREAMAHHSSTRERLPILERFFSEALGAVAPLSSVLDLACGLNPLAIPWMPLGPQARYYGCDMYTDMVEFLNAALPLLGVRGEITACDLAQSLPTVKADVALILKSLPCLEQLAPSLSARLLRELKCDVLLVSYPLRSLGGRAKGMLHNYEEQFWALVEGEGWAVERLQFETELAFVVNKNLA
jgi:16S rRNA (guanine(1405)-N(7))-methyltransferase